MVLKSFLILIRGLVESVIIFDQCHNFWSFVVGYIIVFLFSVCSLSLPPFEPQKASSLEPLLRGLRTYMYSLDAAAVAKASVSVEQNHHGSKNLRKIGKHLRGSVKSFTKVETFLNKTNKQVNRLLVICSSEISKNNRFLWISRSISPIFICLRKNFLDHPRRSFPFF